MQFPGLNRRRSRTTLLLLGQLVLIAYVFQIGAFDHWHHGDTHADMTPVERAVHASHCHGDTGGCADSGVGVATLAPGDIVRLPAAPDLWAADPGDSVLQVNQAFIPNLSQPPKAA